jgi:hypothetical protein
MKKLLFVLALSLPTVSCGDDSGGNGNTCATGTTEVNGECVADVTCGAGTMAMDGMCIPTPPPGPTFVQVEHLARPGINEVFLFSAGFADGYNATAPSFTGVPQATLDQVVAEAKTVMKALYLGACLLDGVIPGINATTGVHPAGATCSEVGGAIFTENDPLAGVTLTATTKADAAAYADRVFAQFVPDVMRINVGAVNNRPVSAYETLCGNPADPKPLLCGGRHLRDDVIDITYDYLLNGAGTCAGGLCGAQNQVNSLVSDGVDFDPRTVSITASVVVTTTATHTTQVAHGLAVGDTVTIRDSNQAGLNGKFTVATVPSTTSFTTTVANGTLTGAAATVSTNVSSRINGANTNNTITNSEQGHNNVTKVFPYSAAPF